MKPIPSSALVPPILDARAVLRADRPNPFTERALVLIRSTAFSLWAKSPDRRVSPAKLESHGTLAPFDHREV